MRLCSPRRSSLPSVTPHEREAQIRSEDEPTQERTLTYHINPQTGRNRSRQNKEKRPSTIEISDENDVRLTGEVDSDPVELVRERENDRATERVPIEVETRVL